MATSLKDLTDAQILAAYQNWYDSNGNSWAAGRALLPEVSRRFGARLDPEFYRLGIRRIVAIKPSVKGRERDLFPKDFIIPLPEIMAIVADATRDVCLAVIDNDLPEMANITLRYEPPIIKDNEQFRAEADALLGDRRGLFADMSSRRLLTFGSCFAVNMGRALRERGQSVYTLVIAEDVNSCFNNLQLLRAVFLGEHSTVSEELRLISELDYAALKEEFCKATDIVFTLGNIFHLENDGQPTLYGKDGAVLVAESVAETTACLREIFDLLAKFTGASVLASVSPIPIFGYRGSDFSSAMEADCVSKSQLRVALNECLRDFPAVRYIPTFEIFRWLPAHQAFPTFGLDDSNPRHINQALLNRVLDSIAGGRSAAR